MATTDTTTDDYTDGKPPPPPATKADPCVPSQPRTAPGCVLGRARPGWVGVGRGRRWGVILVDACPHRLRGRLRGDGFEPGGVSCWRYIFIGNGKSFFNAVFSAAL